MKNKLFISVLMALVLVAVMAPSVLADSVDVAVTVGNIAPEFCDAANPGTVTPNLFGDGNKTVDIEASVYDDNDNSDITGVTAKVMKGAVEMVSEFSLTPSGSGTGSCTESDRYIGSFDVAPCDDSGSDWKVVYTVTDGVNSTTHEEMFTVASTIGLELDLSSVSFSSMDPGDTSTVTGDTTFGSGTLTVRSIGNSDIDIEVDAPDLVGTPSGTIADENLECQIGALGFQDMDTAIARGFDADLGCNTTQNVDLRLTVPVGTTVASYGSAITFTAVAASTYE